MWCWVGEHTSPISEPSTSYTLSITPKSGRARRNAVIATSFARARTTGEKAPDTLALRQKILLGCEQIIWDFFDAGGQVVIYDANNGTKAKRSELA